MLIVKRKKKLQICVNTIGNYHCDCVEGTERGESGLCEAMVPGECSIMPVRSVIGAFRGTNVNVKVSVIFLIFPKTKKDLVVLSRQCCLFCLLKS